MCQGGKDFQRFLGNTLLFIAAHVAEGPHVVQAVSQFDDDDAHVLGHGQKHFTHTVELLVFFRPIIETAQFRDAIDEEGHFFAEIFFNIIEGHDRIFNDIVQEGRRNGRRVDFHFRQDLGYGQRVENVRFPTDAELFLMGFTGNLIGSFYIVTAGLWLVAVNGIE